MTLDDPFDYERPWIPPAGLYLGLTSEEYDADLADVLAAEEEDRDVWASEQAAAADPLTEAEDYVYWHGGDDG